MVLRRIGDINPGQKWWQTILGIGFSCTQWGGSTCTQGGPYFFHMGKRRGWRGRGNFFGILVFPPCPQSVPYRFPKPFFSLLGEKRGRGHFFGILVFPPCPQPGSQRFSQHFPSLMCFPKLFPIAPNFIHSFCPKLKLH